MLGSMVCKDVWDDGVRMLYGEVLVEKELDELEVAALGSPVKRCRLHLLGKESTVLVGARLA